MKIAVRFCKFFFLVSLSSQFSILWSNQDMTQQCDSISYLPKRKQNTKNSQIVELVTLEKQSKQHRRAKKCLMKTYAMMTSNIVDITVSVFFFSIFFNPLSISVSRLFLFFSFSFFLLPWKLMNLRKFCLLRIIFSRDVPCRYDAMIHSKRQI